MPVCPECDHMPVESCPTSVDGESYALVQTRVWPQSYNGIIDATARIDGITEGDPGIRLEIDQSAYATENFYQHRRKHEGMAHLEVVDVEPGLVDVWFRETRTTITAWRCPECGLRWDDTLGVIGQDTGQQETARDRVQTEGDDQ